MYIGSRQTSKTGIWRSCGSPIFLLLVAMTMVMPFLSLYIETFGNFSETYVRNWSGWVFAITFLTAFAFSPFWGRSVTNLAESQF